MKAGNVVGVMERFMGKVVVVMGAGSAIGAATVRRSGREGGGRRAVRTFG